MHFLPDAFAMRRVIQYVILFLFTFLLCTPIKAQTDTTFWFAAPEVLYFTYNNVAMDRPIVFNITTYNESAIVTITQPANGGMPAQTISIPANATKSVDLTAWIDNIECKPANSILNNGIKISSTANISAYYEVNANGYNPDLFVLKGNNALGKDFWISSQFFLDNQNGSYSSFNIVATEDNTTVTITPSKNIVGHAANTPFTITLNKGQTYAAVATSGLAADHLQGSHVTSTKPIAITLSDDELAGTPYGGCADLGGDQTFPVDNIGNEYVAVKGGLNNPFDKLYILATQDGTTVYQDGVLLSTLNSGQSYETSLSNASTYIKSSLPVYVYQLSGIGCEAGTAILPKISTCNGNSSITFTRTSNEYLYLTLLVQNGGQNNFLVNNTPGIVQGFQFSPVPGTANQWYTAKIQLNNPVGSPIKVSNSTHLFHAGVLQGGQISGTGFGYFSDFGNIRVNAYSDAKTCDGNPIYLYADTVASASYKWSGPNGFSSNIQNPIIANATPIHSGKYYLTVTVPGCGDYYDSVAITVRPNSSATISKTICEGESFLGHTTSGTYADKIVAANGCDSNITTHLTVLPKSYTTITQTICQGESYQNHSTSGIFKDTLPAANGCDSIITLNLTVLPVSYKNIDTTICEDETFLGYHQSGTYIDTLVSANGCDSIRTLTLLVAAKGYSAYTATICKGQNFFGYTASGTYVDTLQTLYGCDSIRTIKLIVLDNCEVYFPTAFSPNNDGNNDIFRMLNANNISDYSLTIYNRWGEKIFETKDYNKGWDGTLRGKLQPGGMYIWQSHFKKMDKQENMQGTVVLIR